MSMMDSHVETVDDLLKGIEGEFKGDRARCESDLAEVDETLKQMGMEIHSVAQKAKKDEYQAKIKQFQARAAAGRKALLFQGASGSAAGAGGAGAQIAAKQASAEEKQQASLAVLQRARQQLAETEAIGVETVQHLDAQNKQLASQKEKMVEINSNLNHSNKLLNKMSQWWRG